MVNQITLQNHSHNTRSFSPQAYTCHFNLIPVQRSLKPGQNNAPPCMQGIVMYSVLLCFALYAAVGSSGARGGKPACNAFVC